MNRGIPSFGRLYVVTILWWLLIVITIVDSNLEAYGCEPDWHNHLDHCYRVVSLDSTADDAKNHCEGLGAHLASVWLDEEKDFIKSAWHQPFPMMAVNDFLWIGLRGTSNGFWKFDDKSALQTKLTEDLRWSVLDGVPGVPASPNDKCGALRPSGVLSFLDCSMKAPAFVCKKSLPKVYVTGIFVNNTGTTGFQAADDISHEQLFERVYPPQLSSFPDDSLNLAVTDVATELMCAYNCFTIKECRVFQVSCNTHSKCDSFQCRLYPKEGLTF